MATKSSTGLDVKTLERNCCLAETMGVASGKTGGISTLLRCLDALIEGDNHIPELNVYASKALPTVRDLLSSVRSGDIDGVSAAASRLAGFGPGLTPSGDDVLAGFMSSLLLGAKALNRDIDYAMEINQTILSSVIGRTTQLSQRLLEDALLGEAPEPVSRAINALLMGNDDEVEEAVSALLAWGHTSGADSLLGILLGFHAILSLDIENGRS